MQTEATSEPPPRAARRTASARSVYPITDDTGPNASSEWTSSASGSAQLSSTGDMKAPPSTTPMAAVRAGDLRRIERAVGELAAGVEHGLHGGAHVGELLQGGQGAHGDALGARVAEHDALARSGRPTAAMTSGTSSCGTMARRIAVHFWPALAVISVTSGLDEGVELRRALDGVRAQDRGVQGVGLGGEADAALRPRSGGT